MIFLVVLLALFIWFVTKMVLTGGFDEIADEKGIEFGESSTKKKDDKETS